MNSLMIIFFSEIPEKVSEFLRLQADYAKFNSRVWCVKTKLNTKNSGIAYWNTLMPIRFLCL